MPNPESQVVQALRQYRVRMDAVDASLMQDMGVRWLQIELRLESNIAALAEEMARRTAAGEVITQQLVWKAERYQILKAQMQAEILRYNKDFAVSTIASAQERAAILGIDAAQDAIFLSYPSPLSANFNRINVSAVESMIGFAGDGSPLNSLLRNDYPDAYNGLTDALIDGLANGSPANQIAREMAEGMGMGLDRSLLIARTETQRAYRTASTQQYRDSGVVSGFRRLVKKDGACVACLMLDGEFFETEHELDDHPNGRCTAVPVVRGVDPPQWETGQEWFANLDEAQQRGKLGDARFELYAGGTPLSAFASKHQDKLWGASPRVVPVSELMTETEMLKLKNDRNLEKLRSEENELAGLKARFEELQEKFK